jgi:hypothetical protein
MCPKWFLNLLHFRRKLWTYLPWRLTLSPNGPKQASVWPTSPGGPSTADKKYFYACGTFGANHTAKLISEPMVRLVQPCTYLVLRLIEPLDGPKQTSIWPRLPRRSIGYAQNDFHAHGTFNANHAPISPRLTPSPTESKRSSTWPTSPRGFYWVRPK